MNELVTEQRGAVLVLRLNRPDARNALNWSLLRAIGAAVADAEADAYIRVVIITGTGDRAFCAGMDLRAFADDAAGMPSETEMAAYMRILDGQISIPLIGAANASAVAGGFELLLGCDLVVASTEATFGLPEVKRGLLAGNGAMQIGTRLPIAVAMELGLTGDTIDAARAFQLGLVNAVVPPGDVLDTALGCAERIVANGPLAVTAMKALVQLAAAHAPNVRDRVRELQGIVFGSDDAKEGALAFVEKRAPNWQGR